MPRLSLVSGTRGVNLPSPTPVKPRVILRGESGVFLELPVAPSLSHDGLAQRFNTEDRANRKPLLEAVGPSLRVYTCTILLVTRTPRGLDPGLSVESQLQVLRALARSGERVRWEMFGPSEGGWFRITSQSVQDARREPFTQHITVAAVSLTLTEASDAQIAVGPLTGGAAGTGVPGTAAGGSGASGGFPRTHVVTAGESLTTIAQSIYGNGDLWPLIAEANGITNPHHILTGTTLTIPDPGLPVPPPATDVRGPTYGWDAPPAVNEIRLYAHIQTPYVGEPANELTWDRRDGRTKQPWPPPADTILHRPPTNPATTSSWAPLLAYPNPLFVVVGPTRWDASIAGTIDLWPPHPDVEVTIAVSATDP